MFLLFSKNKTNLLPLAEYELGEKKEKKEMSSLREPDS